MTSLFSYLLTFLAIIFWAFRAVVTVMYQLDNPLFAQPSNVTFEIIVLFATLPCLIGVVKRNIVFAAAYLGLYATYFGNTLYYVIQNASDVGITLINSADMLCTVIGIIIPLLTFFDILLNKHRTLGNGAKKEDWFYANEEYDRKFDERADRNQYRL